MKKNQSIKGILASLNRKQKLWQGFERQNRKKKLRDFSTGGRQKKELKTGKKHNGRRRKHGSGKQTKDTKDKWGGGAMVGQETTEEEKMKFEERKRLLREIIRSLLRHRNSQSSESARTRLEKRNVREEGGSVGKREKDETAIEFGWASDKYTEKGEIMQRKARRTAEWGKKTR